MTHGANQYKKTSITTASREQILLMLYEAAIKNVKIASDAIQKKDVNRKGIAIGKAHDIVIELISSLDHNVGGKVAADLEQLYNFLIQHLVDANVENSVKKLNEVSEILQNLLEGWRGAVEKLNQERAK